MKIKRIQASFFNLTKTQRNDSRNLAGAFFTLEEEKQKSGAELKNVFRHL